MKRQQLLFLGLVANLFVLILLSPTITALADPTPTPRMFSASELLTRMAPKPFATFSMSVPFNNTAPGESVLDSGGWMTTFLAMYEPFNVVGTLGGIAIVLMIAFWITRKLTTTIRKRPMSPAEAYFRTNYREYKSSSFSRSGRRR